MNRNTLSQQMLGFTVLEVLTALFLFSLILATLLPATLKQSRQLLTAHYFQQASYLANNLNQYLQCHPEPANSYLTKWQSQIRASLPQASGTIINQNRIQITWGGMQSSQCQSTTTGPTGCLIENISVYSKA